MKGWSVMKACPYCAEQIQDAAIKCRYCGEAVPVVSTPEPIRVPVAVNSAPALLTTPEQGKRAQLVGGGAILAFIGAVGLYIALDEGVQSVAIGATGGFVVWAGIALALTLSSPIVRWGGSFFLTACVVSLIAAVQIGTKPSSPGDSGNGIVAAVMPKPKTDTDLAGDVLEKELNAQHRGDTCQDCWAPDGERNLFKNLIEFELKTSQLCTRGPAAVPVANLLILNFRAKTQNGFGAESWDDWQAIAGKVAGAWKLVSIVKQESVGGQGIDVCMVAGITGVLEKYGGPAPVAPAKAK